MGLDKVSCPEVPFYISLLSEIFSNIMSSGIPKEKERTDFAINVPNTQQEKWKHTRNSPD